MTVILHSSDGYEMRRFQELGREAQFAVLHLSGTFQEVLARCRQSSPTVLIVSKKWLDILSSTQRIDLLRSDQSVRLIVCRSEGDKAGYEEFVNTACWGIISTETSVDELAQICKAVAKGEMWATREMLSRLIRHFISGETTGKLSRRERQIMELMATGKTNKNMAAELFLSEETIRWHLRNMYSKTGVVGRHDMIRYAQENLIASTACQV